MAHHSPCDVAHFDAAQQRHQRALDRPHQVSAVQHAGPEDADPGESLGLGSLLGLGMVTGVMVWEVTRGRHGQTSRPTFLQVCW